MLCGKLILTDVLLLMWKAKMYFFFLSLFFSSFYFMISISFHSIHQFLQTWVGSYIYSLVLFIKRKKRKTTDPETILNITILFLVPVSVRLSLDLCDDCKYSSELNYWGVFLLDLFFFSICFWHSSYSLLCHLLLFLICIDLPLFTFLSWFHRFTTRPFRIW